MVLYIIYRMTPISVICHFYVPPDTPIISLLLEKEMPLKLYRLKAVVFTLGLENKTVLSDGQFIQNLVHLLFLDPYFGFMVEKFIIG